MRVFVTGATGWVGSALVAELLAAGHHVLGFARSEAKAEALAQTGAEVLLGTIEDTALLERAAAGVDGVVHTAFNHDFSKFAESGAVEGRAIAALGAALSGSNRPLVVTSGVAFFPPGRPAVESDRLDDSRPFPRKPEAAIEALAAAGVRAMAVRLAPTVHAAGDHGFVARLVAIARARGASAYVGDGTNTWPAVHRLDAARLFRLALETGTVGARYHAVAEEGILFRRIAEAIGAGLGVPVVSLAPENAAEHFGPFAMFAGINVAASSAATRSELGWTPTHPGLLDDLAQPFYFAG